LASVSRSAYDLGPRGIVQRIEQLRAEI